MTGFVERVNKRRLDRPPFRNQFKRFQFRLYQHLLKPFFISLGFLFSPPIGTAIILFIYHSSIQINYTVNVLDIELHADALAACFS